MGVSLLPGQTASAPSVALTPTGKASAPPLSNAGIALSIVAKKLVIERVDAGQPAAIAGVRAGDVVLAIDDKTTSGLRLAAAQKLLVGLAGSVLTLRLARAKNNEQQIELALLRASASVTVRR